MATSSGTYVQFGAGNSAPEGWLNFDVSPTLRVQRLPVVGKALARLSGNAGSFPDGVIYGDIVAGLPLPPGSVDALFASHVLEHLAFEEMRRALVNSFAVLKPGGIFRLIVPNLLPIAEAYVERARGGTTQAAPDFIRATMMGQEVRPATVFGKIRAQLGNSLHLWMWDHPSMEAELKSVGFVDIRPAQFGDSGDDMFARVEEYDRFVNNGTPEVAIQARKP